MQFINKHTGTVGANLDYQGSGKWSLHVSDDNHFRVLTGIDDNIKAIDINLMAGMIEVGKKLPGYNREVREITPNEGDIDGQWNGFMVECFGW